MLAAEGHPARVLVPELLTLLSNSMAKSSWALYQRALQLLQEFMHKFSFSFELPLPPAMLALYVSYLYKCGYASSSITTYLSAISFIHKISNVTDSTSSFLVQKVLLGVKKVKPAIDARLPITLPVLNKLVGAAEVCVQGFYHISMFKSMLLLAFAVFLRVGEMSLSQGNKDNILKLSNIEFLERQTGLRITFTNYKHSAGKTARVVTRDQATIEALVKFLNLRGNAPGFLFVWPSGSPITRAVFNKMLQSCLKFCDLDTSVYKSHSLRIGAACHAAAQGFSHVQIRQLGRWNSDAFLKYIRLH